MKRVSLTNIAVAIGFLLVGIYASPAREPVTVTRTDTIPPAAMVNEVQNLRLANHGLRAKLAGQEAVVPSTITVTDTLVTPPDTVLQLVRVEDQTLTLAPLIKGDSLWAPEIHRFDIAGCDDGFSWNAGELVCDRARLGHLALYAEAGVAGHPFSPIPNLAYQAAVGVQWTPSFRSGWRVSTALAMDGRATLTIRKGWSVW